jgi:hypothetical protein
VDSPGNPLCCSANDADPRCIGAPPTFQVRAKAYPGLRELALIRSLGSQGAVGSVCPRQLDDPQGADFGYRPAIAGIIDGMKGAFGPQCLPKALETDGSGRVACAIIEARNTQGACSCDAPARRNVPQEHEDAVAAIREDPIAAPAGWDCFCEVLQLEGDDLQACQSSVDEPVLNNGQPVDGWCYIDALVSPPIGDPAIVADCPLTERRILRFLGEAQALAGATLYLTCDGGSGQ